MLLAPLYVPQIRREVLEPLARVKLDTGSDGAFYGAPRLVNHVDDDFLRQLTQLYRQRVPQGGCVLDLMSSWVSHLPPEVSYCKVTQPNQGPAMSLIVGVGEAGSR